MDRTYFLSVRIPTPDGKYLMLKFYRKEGGIFVSYSPHSSTADNPKPSVFSNNRPATQLALHSVYLNLGFCIVTLQSFLISERLHYSWDEISSRLDLLFPKTIESSLDVRFLGPGTIDSVLLNVTVSERNLRIVIAHHAGYRDMIRELPLAHAIRSCLKV